MSVSYPEPPWQTHGRARFLAYSVDASRVRPPPGFEVEARLGRSLGILGYVEYEPPSPLSYREVLWMPARVRARLRDGSVARGWYVAKMLVDDASSLAAGRAEWALPKQLARFEGEGATVTMRGEDGSRIEWTSRTLGALPGRGSVVTLQRRGDELVRFRGDFSGRAAPARARVRASGLDGTWQGLDGARPLPFLALELSRFRAVMQPPRSASI
ncbi:MAG: acetoacetate decarboxylase family protein [Sandaracinaceae bacterium]|nr:acetoacetate decarboxylase family protein [Sandaracinaceae bacterium]